MSRRNVARALAASPFAVLAPAFAGRETVAGDGNYKPTWKESSSSNIVLGFNKEAVKPTFKEFAADLDDSAMKEASTGGNGNTKGFQSGKRVDESGSAYKTASLTG